MYRDVTADVPEAVYIDWSAADAELLISDRIQTTALKNEEVCAVRACTEKGLYTDEILGLKKVPIEEIVAALYADEARLAKFREIHQIARYKTLDELYDAGWFFDSGKLTATEGDDDEA